MIKVLIDENLSEYFAEGLNQLQKPLDNGILITSIAKEFHKGIKDEDWIPEWGAQAGIFITQDIKITTTRQQAALLKQYSLGAFFLKTPKGYRYWQKVELIIKHWPKIATIINEKKTPYCFAITPTGVKQMS